MDNATNYTFSSTAKTFLESCCSNVLETVKNNECKDKVKMLSDGLFYSHYIDKIQIKFFLYKLNEFKMKQFAEENYYKRSSIHFEKKEFWNTCKKDAGKFLNKIVKKTSEEYNKYSFKVLMQTILIQRRFRGHLYRLIHKMDLMNMKIEADNRKAEERVRRRTLAKMEEKKNEKNGNNASSPSKKKK